MEVEGVRLEQAAVVALRLQPLAQRVGRNGFPVDAEFVLHQRAHAVEPGRIVEPVREHHAPVDDVAVDAVARDPRADQVDRVDGEPVQPAPFVAAERAQQVGVVEAVAAEDEAAVATRCAEADAFAVEHDDVLHAALDEAERRAQAGEAAADDADLRVDRAGQLRVGLAGNGGFVEVLHAISLTLDGGKQAARVDLA